MGALKAAFIFLAPDSNPEKQRTKAITPSVELDVIPVNNYDEACRVVQELVSEGVVAIELCGGFGNIGVAKIVEAINGAVPVGVVRFDLHPGLNNKSGDVIFKNQ